jgi:formate hydrogenlyase subunit 3/multisubunit Na+/H+ antiporter MnhD subunit
MTVVLWLVSLLPAAVGAVLAGGGISRAGVIERCAAPAAVLTAAGTMVAAGLLATARPQSAAAFLPGLPLGVGVDALSALMTVTVAGVSLLVLVYAASELGRDSHQARGRFFGFMLLFTAGMQLTITATTTVALLIGWELMGATSYALIGFWWPEPRRAESATVAFLTTRAGDLGLYVAAGAAARRRRRRPVGGDARCVLWVAAAARGRSARGGCRQIGAAAVLLLAVAGDGWTQSGVGAAALSDHGRRRRVFGAARRARCCMPPPGPGRRCPGWARSRPSGWDWSRWPNAT